jgi:hypothetical protein
MSPQGDTVSIPVERLKRSLRAEAADEPAPVSTAPTTSETQIIAIYGKGGIGKSFTLANLSYMMAQQGKKVLLIGCDPKSDTTSLLFGGRACPTIIETSSRKKLAGEQLEIGDVCFKRDGVYAMELGGPEVGRGCGGRGIIHGFETLEKLGFHDWGFDYVLLDFLGDVVCGGFGLPIARDMCQKVIVVGSNDLRWNIFANSAVTLGSPGSSSTKTTIRARRKPLRRQRASLSSRRSLRTKISGVKVRTTKSSAVPNPPGARSSPVSQRRWLKRRRFDPSPYLKMSSWGFSKVKPSVEMWFYSLRRSKTCVALARCISPHWR